MYIPTTKWALIREIKAHAPQYTRDEIERVYDQVRFKEPRRAVYYAKKAGIKRLQAFLVTIKKQKNGI